MEAQSYLQFSAPGGFRQDPPEERSVILYSENSRNHKSADNKNTDDERSRIAVSWAGSI